MDPMASWDAPALKHTGVPPDDDIAYYLQDYRDFDHLFDDALSTLQDLDVPSGYGHAPPPPPARPARHAKKPSGTAIFGFLDHTRDWSLGPAAPDDLGMMRPPPAPALPGSAPPPAPSISPSQLARTPAVSHEQLAFNFDEPFDTGPPLFEASKPFVLREEDEDAHGHMPAAPAHDDLTVTNRSPASYKFPPAQAAFAQLVGLSTALPRIHHPRRPHQYPAELAEPALPDQHPEPARPDAPPTQRWVPIPLPRLSPVRPAGRGPDSPPDDGLVDANETIVQLTPQRPAAPAGAYLLSPGQASPGQAGAGSPRRSTPRASRITLEWSPVISPSGKATQDVRKAIQELSPKRLMKKTSLLPPGELDKYWQGPDADKNFTCVYQNCGKKFTRRYNVRSHIQTHLSDRPFTCAYCPKSFVRQHDLNRHVKSHMVSKHCRCHCGREFTRIEGYKKHLANGVCLRPHDDSGAVSKPGAHRAKGELVLDGLTSNRLNEDLCLGP
ncbi:hypothetical protein METBIDRAFT_13264 [Metschnikowia bicuspidata var. bicuspidata NRRL YB-4993]|uniref:C2H2-type domain-containing protein n=1 Tax=Metschnikowia bicuspidata var. bicuspidata NRRL YB-4993 TaxID=869754 RepID=A0A1A0H6B8_9ASCO|nr:hypothetical protein METBIDRAFT_13264 [Metschnikowia bicuspidata var. bicuspidata NRRL YB-4993]OBA19505.1 hypothetical protein METBIDRAFT_13264 [Metschnikowia bicuspidata var. bicuspidata NRRL YB-4993]